MSQYIPQELVHLQYYKSLHQTQNLIKEMFLLFSKILNQEMEWLNLLACIKFSTH